MIQRHSWKDGSQAGGWFLDVAFFGGGTSFGGEKVLAGEKELVFTRVTRGGLTRQNEEEKKGTGEEKWFGFCWYLR